MCDFDDYPSDGRYDETNERQWHQVTGADDDQEDYGAGHTGTFEAPAAAVAASADDDNPQDVGAE